MSTFDNPFDPANGLRSGCRCGRHATDAEHARDPQLQCAPVESEDARYTTGSVVGADGGQAVGYFLSVPGRRFSGGRID